MNYYIGLDGGGSQTRAVLIDDDLVVLGRGVAGASNHYVVGRETAAAHCAEAAAAALADALRIEPRLNTDSIVAWGFGLAGVRRTADAEAMRTHLDSAADGLPWLLDTDAAAAQAGAFGGGAGIVLINGTGAICFGRDDYSESFYADGWGRLLGDEGSGYWIGVEAMKAVCRAADGRGPRTALTSPVLDVMGVADTDALVRYVYSHECSPEHIARLARVVLDAAGSAAGASGNQVAVEIRDRAVLHLANAAASVARRMLIYTQARAALNQQVAQDIAVALCGGLFEDDHFRACVGYQFGEQMIALKRDFLPLGSWRVVKPLGDAAMGAALLARQAYG